MSVVCLYFPRLAVELAVRHRRELAGRPLVFVEGTGGDAPVAQRSAEAASRGVLIGMRAAEARKRAAGAAFLPHRPEEHRRELALIASELSAATGLPVSVGRDALFIPLPGGELTTGARISQEHLIETLGMGSGLTASVGMGDNADAAFSTARFEARRAHGGAREVRSSAS